MLQLGGLHHGQSRDSELESGGPLAAAWAVLHHVGDDGYMKIEKGLLEARDALVKGIADIPEVGIPVHSIEEAEERHVEKQG